MGKPSGLSGTFELLRRLARRHGVPARHAEDVAQDALLRALEANRGIGPDGEDAPYRVTIACNRARNHVRDARRRGEVLTSFEEREIRAEQPTPEELLRARQREELTRRLVGQVDPKYRDVLIKHDLEGIPLAQIAAELGLHPEAVRTRHRRAREQLEAVTQRWRAKQRSRGWDDAACVAPLGLYRRQGWVSSLGRWRWRAVIQGATLAIAGAVVAELIFPSSFSWWFRSAVDEHWTESAAEAPVPLPAAPSNGRAGGPVAAPAGSDGAPLAEHRDDGQAGARASRPHAPSIAASRGAPPPAISMPEAISARERSLIRRARRAFEGRTAEADLEARRLLEAHAQEFPRGRLAGEREEMLRQLR
ncbi:RNA polymerase sigma factor [Sorangium cellulosum]|uniref:RNA polymerase sigma factor n=1 Tax=Sorangium cellulosum TaxID=56 RepID=A0A4P2Q8V6_SORCE|nr:sigma-70 family RNA polymerase sigma factor [Sorangium cellulosum]AUX25493.1 RNA polymerase sigma factor [Sorangium cellulosum]